MTIRWWARIYLFPYLLFVAAVLGAAAMGWAGLKADTVPSLAVGALTKAAFLSAAAWHAFVARQIMRSRAWAFIAGGFIGYMIGQWCLVVYQLVLGIPTPFPSWADPFFVLGTLSLMIGLWIFLHELSLSGCPLDLRRRVPMSSVWILGLGGWALWTLLRPVLHSGAPTIDTWLSLTYPITDLLLLVPTLLLFQVTGPFRGGKVRRTWATLLFGIILFLVGDLLFALRHDGVGPWFHWAVDMSFICGYALVARACAMQHEMVR